MSEKLSELVKKGESEDVEFKKSTAQLDRALKSVCGFLNHKGGKVYFGINKGKIVGQAVSDQTLKSISQKIRQRIKPEISPGIKVLEIDEKSIIEVIISGGKNKPYFLDGVCYKRVGTENIIISPEELERIILEKRKRYFDSEICEGASLEDIDVEKVKWFLKAGKRQHRLEIAEDTSIGDIVMHLNLMHNGKIDNSAVLLFGKDPQKFFMQSEVKCIALPTAEFVKPYLTYQAHGGNLFEQVDKSTAFVLENIHRPLWVEPGEIAARHPYEIPQKAIREAIVNAIVHRDYNSPSKVQVRVFPDRAEIWNPGQLPPQLKIDDLKEPHPSIPYNPLIFRQFYRVAYVEDVGGGTIDIIKTCKESGLPEPEFEQKMGSFITIIRRSFLTDEYLGGMDLNERQITAVKHIGIYGKITRAEYEKLCLVSARTANRELDKLYKKKLIEKKGKGPETYYAIGEIWRDLAR
jgi:ATP-dependent DNA helicase RecG